MIYDGRGGKEKGSSCFPMTQERRSSFSFLICVFVHAYHLLRLTGNPLPADITDTCFCVRAAVAHTWLNLFCICFLPRLRFGSYPGRGFSTFYHRALRKRKQIGGWFFVIQLLTVKLAHRVPSFFFVPMSCAHIRWLDLHVTLFLLQQNPELNWDSRSDSSDFHFFFPRKCIRQPRAWHRQKKGNKKKPESPFLGTTRNVLFSLSFSLPSVSLRLTTSQRQPQIQRFRLISGTECTHTERRENQQPLSFFSPHVWSLGYKWVCVPFSLKRKHTGLR